MLVTVITYGDSVVRKAICRVFPTAQHHLYAWNLIQNATTNIKNLMFVYKFKQRMLGDFDVVEYNRRYDKMVKEFGLKEKLWDLEM